MELKANKYNELNNLQIRDGKELMNRIIDENPNENFDIILDIGCGSGNLTLILSQTFTSSHIVAIDINPKMIEFAKQHNSKDRITYLVQDFSSDWDQLTHILRALEGKVSLIFTNFCLHWIPDRIPKENVVKNMHRLLTSSGKVYINFPYISNILFLDMSSEEKAIHEKEFMKIPTKEEQFDIWYNLFKNNGFTVISNECFAEEWNFERKHFDEIIKPIGLELRKIFFVKSDSHQKKARIGETECMFENIIDGSKEFIDKKTSLTMVNFKHVYYQLVLVIKS